MTEQQMMAMFDSFDNVQECFVTADDQVFFTENHAYNHARTLEDRSISKHMRLTVVEHEPEPDIETDGADDTETEPEVSTEAEAKVKPESPVKAPKAPTKPKR